MTVTMQEQHSVRRLVLAGRSSKPEIISSYRTKRAGGKKDREEKNKKLFDLQEVCTFPDRQPFYRCQCVEALFAVRRFSVPPRLRQLLLQCCVAGLLPGRRNSSLCECHSRFSRRRLCCRVVLQITSTSKTHSAYIFMAHELTDFSGIFRIVSPSTTYA